MLVVSTKTITIHEVDMQDKFLEGMITEMLLHISNSCLVEEGSSVVNGDQFLLDVIDAVTGILQVVSETAPREDQKPEDLYYELVQALLETPSPFQVLDGKYVQ